MELRSIAYNPTPALGMSSMMPGMPELEGTTWPTQIIKISLYQSNSEMKTGS